MKYLWMIFCLLCAVNIAGQVIVNSDGSHSIISGNVIINSGGSHSVKSGNVIINPNGSHTLITGNDPLKSNKSSSAAWHDHGQTTATDTDKTSLVISHESYANPAQTKRVFLEKTITLPATQEAFWNELLAHCGKAYPGTLEAKPAPADFAGKELKMYVMSCDENTIKIPFYVGEDRSRTWVLTKTTDGILLKHDHRLENGSKDEITMYGGLTSNGGAANVQYFPADQETTDLIPDASANLWWVTIDKSHFSYNLRRVTTPNLFTVVFDLGKPVETPVLPWGYE